MPHAGAAACLVHAECSLSLLLLATCTGLDIWAASVEPLIPAILKAHAGLPTIPGPVCILLFPDGAFWFLQAESQKCGQVTFPWCSQAARDTEDAAERMEGLRGPGETLLAPEGGARMDFSSPFFFQPWTLQCPAQRVGASPQIPRTAAKCGVPERGQPS